ncbi:pyridoxal phosphate-dependent decarboxylase family protein [Lutispora thermophila]|uniref:Glutamate or tyrosine decarboxylase n=1 Tax=Lutispora thermophila DSM 19022 TaxID=1122184 RepID=A0A1M6GWU8_9FIRM|nr:pyridoxal-dependent decarboxylase [Lutispora thermophila]SHJ14438.1 Glutamate or tyrosine decarboxylase [Lutispora thermophila DSM 19022]
MNKKYVSPILNNIRITPILEDLSLAADFAKEYIEASNTMRVFPKEEDIAALSVFDSPLSNTPTSINEILKKLHQYGSKATVAQTGGRYFGFVNGGILPSCLCAKWLLDVWDQNPAMFVMSPIGAKLEELCEKWLIQILGLPDETVAGFVSGSSTAIICGLVTGRNYLLKKKGYDVAAKGLIGAPQIKIVLGEGAHSTVLKALSIIGLGYENIIKVPMDSQGRICAEKLPIIDDSTLLILQAGNVNSGAFDNFEEICLKAKEKGAWIHIDGAFGLWAGASPKLCHLTKGIEHADSWSLDGHKTLNTPYDNGIILCRHRDALINAMHMTGSYIQLTEGKRDSMMYTMEMSRRTRAADLWSALCGLGRKGVAELVEELCAKATYFAEELEKIGFEILNDVVFNQILARWKDDKLTQELINKIQTSGVLWLGGTKWLGKTAMRISVCSYKTTYEDIDLCIDEIKRLTSSL